jgi:hypothetical protein
MFIDEKIMSKYRSVYCLKVHSEGLQQAVKV